MRKIPAIFLASLLLVPLVHTLAQPIAMAELPVGSKLTYRLGGVYVGNKTYEVVGWSSSQGRNCKLVRVHLVVNASGSFFYRGINSTSEFCYDDRGRPLEEVLYIPPEFNLSYRKVEITYWWEGNEVFPHRSLIKLIGEKNESYDVLLGEGVVVRESNGTAERFEFSREYDGLEVRVLSLENVETPAGLFPCYKVLLSGWTEDGLPYNSTVYVTVKEPRFTAYYITNIIGIKQTGYVVEVEIPEQRSPIPYPWIVLAIAVAVLLLIMLKKRRKGG